MLDRNDRGAYDPCQTEVLEISSSSSRPRPPLAAAGRWRQWVRGGCGLAALFVLSLVLLVALVVIAVLASEYAAASKRVVPEEASRCTSESCMRVAWRMLSGMDRSADPCSNFYAYACGNWENKRSVPHNHRHSWSTFDELQYDVDNFLRGRLEMQSAPNESIGLTNAKTLYDMCMSLERREDQSFDSMRSKVRELGGAPMTGYWRRRNLTDLAAELLLLNVPTLVNVQARANEQNSTRFILSISPPDVKTSASASSEASQTLPAWLSQYIKLLYNISTESKEMDATFQYMKSFTLLAGAYSTISEWATDEEWQDQTMTIRQLQAENQTVIDWLSLIRRLVGPDVDLDYEIHVKSLEYLQKLNDLLSSTNDGLIANGMVVQLLLGYMDYMPTSVRLLQALLLRYTQGDKFYELPPRWHECLDSVKANYPLVLANVYLNHYFMNHDEIRKDVNQMIANIKQAFEQGISELDWMDKDTKSRALLKLKVMKDYVAFDKLTMNQTYVDAKSSLIVLHKDRSYLSTLFNLTTDRVLASLVKTSSHREDMHETMASPFVVNAFYDMRNSFYIMAAVLQGAFYGYNNPAYINYAAMGYVVGHEITHGFDDDGRKYDSEGNLMSWWQAEAEEVFSQKKQCFIQQYGGMRVAAGDSFYQVDGNLTLSENLADNGGLKSAYRAYERWLKNHGAEKLLPEVVGLGTWQQAFFVSSAQLWCAKYSASGLADVIQSDNHAPAETRVNGVVMNFAKFADAFQCPPASPMNPSLRCEVW